MGKIQRSHISYALDIREVSMAAVPHRLLAGKAGDWTHCDLQRLRVGRGDGRMLAGNGLGGNLSLVGTDLSPG